MRIVIVNPNTTTAVTAMLVAQARRIASPDVEIAGITAAFGVPAIESPAEAAVAGHAVVQAFAEAGPAEAGIVGAYADPGLAGARALMPYPVTGIGAALSNTRSTSCVRSECSPARSSTRKERSAAALNSSKAKRA